MQAVSIPPFDVDCYDLQSQVAQTRRGSKLLASGNMLLFIHGLGSNPRATWERFRELLSRDAVFAKTWRVETFAFPTRRLGFPLISRSPRLQALADGLRTEIENKYTECRRIILVGHSLGGVLARRYLVDELKRNAEIPIKGLVLYAVPNDGAGLARLGATLASWNVQLKQLCSNSDIIADLNRDWRQFAVGSKLPVRVVVGTSDRIVSEESARGFWDPDNVSVVLGATHSDITRPESAEDLRYLILRRFVDVVVAHDPRKLSEGNNIGSEFSSYEIRVDDNGVVGGPAAMGLALYEYLYDTSTGKKLNVIDDRLVAIRNEIAEFSAATSIEARTKVVELKRYLSERSFFGVPIEDVYTEVMLIVAEQFGKNEKFVRSNEELLQIAGSVLFYFDRKSPPGSRFDVFPKDDSWSLCFYPIRRRNS